MNKDKFFLNVVETKESFKVSRLTKLYYKSLYDETFHECGGAVSFIKSMDKDGFCQVLYNEIIIDCNNTNERPITINFTNAYTKDGERVFVKHDKDELRLDFMKGEFIKL